MEVGCVKVVDITKCASEANGFKGLIGVIKVDEAMDTRRVGSSELFMEGVESAVEAGARVEQSSEGGVGGCLRFA